MSIFQLFDDDAAAAAGALFAQAVNNQETLDALAERQRILAELDEELSALELATGVPLVALRTLLGLTTVVGS